MICRWSFSFQYSRSGYFKLIDRYTIERVSGPDNCYSEGRVIGDKPLKGVAYWEVKFITMPTHLKARAFVGITAHRLTSYYGTDYCVSLGGGKCKCDGAGTIQGTQGDSIGFLIKKNMMFVFHNGKYAKIYSKLNPKTDYYPVIHLIAKLVRVRVKFPRVFPKTPTVL